MSAALALDLPVRSLPDGTAVGLPGLPGAPGMPMGRPRLRLVPTGPDVDAVARPVRMTRRGRLLRSGVAAAVALTAGWTIVSAVTAGAATPHVVTVTRGQTLSEIAAQQLPDLPVRQGVAALQLENGLNTADIHAGQVLTIPVAG
ncbi:MAG: LysM peptidoglycan-binding domain-containing protein [Lapillicoccus sp.]